jgi:hypothetical protein
MALFDIRSTLNGLLKTLVGTDAPDGTPANDAGRIPILNAGGQLDAGFVPVAGSTFAATNGTTVLTGGEALTFVASVTELADADDVTLPVMAFASAGAAGGAAVEVITPGHVVSGLSGMTPNARQYLSLTAGGITEDPSIATGGFAVGNGVQYLGRAISATELMFQPADIAEL